jgi:hypothetical protein
MGSKLRKILAEEGLAKVSYDLSSLEDELLDILVEVEDIEDSAKEIGIRLANMGRGTYLEKSYTLMKDFDAAEGKLAKYQAKLKATLRHAPASDQGAIQTLYDKASIELKKLRQGHKRAKNRIDIHHNPPQGTLYVVIRPGATLEGHDLQFGDIIERYSYKGNYGHGHNLYRGFGFPDVAGFQLWPRETLEMFYDAGHPAKSHFKVIARGVAKNRLHKGKIPSATVPGTGPVQKLTDVFDMNDPEDYDRHRNTSIYSWRYNNDGGHGSGFTSLRIEHINQPGGSVFRDSLRVQDGDAARVSIGGEWYWLTPKGTLKKIVGHGWPPDEAFIWPSRRALWPRLLDVLWAKEFSYPGFNMTRK